MSNAKITSAEVAKLAGVSQSAVSRVFTPGASASKTTTERVKKAAFDLGYRPNVLLFQQNLLKYRRDCDWI